MQLTVLICTFNEGIKKVKDVLLEPRPDIKYFISHQITCEYYAIKPPELRREDVTIDRIFGAGLSRNRNNAILKAGGDIFLIADDDVKYQDFYFDEIIQTFQRESIDVALFKIKTFEGQPEYKLYPSKEFDVTKKNIPNVSSIEIAFLRKSVKNNVFFDENFGLGSNKLTSGEEHIFIHDCLNQKLKVKFYPTYIVMHSFERTNARFPKFYSSRNIQKGATDARIYGRIAVIKSIFHTIWLIPRLIFNKINPFKYLSQRLEGNLLILKQNKYP